MDLLEEEKIDGSIEKRKTRLIEKCFTQKQNIVILIFLRK